MKHRLSLVIWLIFLMLGGTAGADASHAAVDTGQVARTVDATTGPARVAQAQPAQAPARPPAAATPPAAAAPADAQPADDEPIGNVATLTGSATVTRNNTPTPLKVQDDIFLNDVLQTSANSTLGVTFNDATTFNLTANASITIDNYVYEDGGKQNAALFDIAKGTVAFVAAEVAHTGDMKISTPTATLGIRGTTGLVEVPEGAAANNPNNVAIKLYPDADGRVGRIEVNDRNGARLGFLTQGASGFTIRPGAGGRFTAAPLVDFAAAGAARPGHRAPGPCRAKRRPPDRHPAARVAAGQSEPEQSAQQSARVSPACSGRTTCRNGRTACRSVPARRKRRASRTGRKIDRDAKSARPIQPPPGTPRSANGPGIRQPGPPPGLQRPGFPNRPALQRRAPPPKGKQEKERR